MAGRTCSGRVPETVCAAGLGEGDEVDEREVAAEDRVATILLLELHRGQAVVPEQQHL
jgi:hypothetical protein